MNIKYARIVGLIIGLIGSIIIYEKLGYITYLGILLLIVGYSISTIPKN